MQILYEYGYTHSPAQVNFINKVNYFIFWFDFCYQSQSFTPITDYCFLVVRITKFRHSSN